MKKVLSLIAILFVHHFSGAQPPKNWSSADILNGMQKLGETGSVLYIAAHPDDENTRLLSYLENEKHFRAGYLSMTRGDGGQNLIGKEQGELLGLIRTQELLAARRTDGAEQFFTRANDFGFSKNPEETFTFWNHDSILADVVWVIRVFQPDIIITRFATDGSGGHGHHTASAILAGEAFDAAADPTKFPEQLKYVHTWQAKRLLYNSTARFSNPNADLSQLIKLDVGLFNPVLGKSYGELSAESRSMHKSQGFGSARLRGSNLEYFKPLKGDTTITDVFQNLDLSWNKVKGGEKMEQLSKQIVASFNPLNPSASLSGLIELYDALAHVEDATLRERKQKETLEIILACSGIFAEAFTNAPATATGDTVRITTSLINRSSSNVVLENISLKGLMDTSSAFSLVNNQLFSWSKVIRIPENSEITNPYWLSQPHGNGLFTVRNQLLIGKPENDASLIVVVKLNIAGHDFDVACPVRYKWVEPSDGERYRPFVISPPVTVTFSEDVIVFPSATAKPVTVRLRAGRDSVSGSVRLLLPPGWKSTPESVAYALAGKGNEEDVHFTVTPPSSTSEVTVHAEATSGNQHFSRSLVEIKYDHIPVQTYFSESHTRLVKPDLKKSLHNIGYIEGAGDEIPACLSQLGYTVTMLDEKKLGDDSLQRFDAIVVGIRAFNTNERLILHKKMLMDYVRAGGNLVVQYNTNNFLGPMSGDIGPYPFKISRDRVTHEEAAVTFELPSHPLLTSPNKITAKDFDGWIQERGIYFAQDWDSLYQAPLSMNDPGEKPMKGSTLVAHLGKGYFIYTGLVFFRELPAGVPGAYRLFVNMIEMGR